MYLLNGATLGGRQSGVRTVRYNIYIPFMNIGYPSTKGIQYFLTTLTFGSLTNVVDSLIFEISSLH